jgi:integrase
MSKARLTDALVRHLKPPATGNRIVYDGDVKGFGARVTANGARAYVLSYTTRVGRQRRYTIGGCDHWTATDARRRAKELKAEIDQGGDPLADIEAEREAPNMAALLERFRAEHLVRLRPSSAVDYERMIRCHILPHFERMKVADVGFADVDALHRKITKARHGYRANHTIALLSKMFSLAVRWGWRETNPCRGIERNRQHHRRRYVTPDELERLTAALAEADRDVADAIRLLLLTGARRGEVLAMKWADLDLAAGTWSKPPSSTKQAEHHQVPLSAPARTLLAARNVDGEYVFPGAGQRGHVVNIHRAWQRLCKAAGITGLRIHDLRHSYASALVSAGHSLPLIGALLGHTQPQTTARYAHLFDDPLRKATEQVGAMVTNAGKEAPEPTPLKHGRRS